MNLELKVRTGLEADRLWRSDWGDDDGGYQYEDIIPTSSYYLQLVPKMFFRHSMQAVQLIGLSSLFQVLTWIFPTV